jgi:hypothetical protein
MWNACRVACQGKWCIQWRASASRPYTSTVSPRTAGHITGRQIVVLASNQYCSCSPPHVLLKGKFEQEPGRMT